MNVIPYIFGLGLGVFGFSLFRNKNRVLSKDGLGVAKFLMQKGYSKENASGIAGNLFVESTFNPVAVGDNGTSFGLAQWHKSRWHKLNEFAKANNLNPNTFEGQLKFLDYELKTTERKAYRELLKATTPYDSAYVFAKYYERPKVISPVRMTTAEEIYKLIN